MHDPRIGRFFAIDPLAKKYPHNGPYNFSENRVIDGVELEGLEWQPVNSDGDPVATDSEDIADYNWVGFNRTQDYWQANGTKYYSKQELVTSGNIIVNVSFYAAEMVAPEGTVSDAVINGKNEVGNVVVYQIC